MVLTNCDSEMRIMENRREGGGVGELSKLKMNCRVLYQHQNTRPREIYSISTRRYHVM